MNWDSFAEFREMGGYALYVWGSYALTFIVLALNLFIPLRREQKLFREIGRRALRQKRMPT